MHDLNGARQRLQETSQALSASTLAVGGDAVTLGLLADINECLEDMQRQETYDAVGSKKMAYMQQMHHRQRACGGSRADDDYGTTRTREMKSVFKSSIM